MNWLIKTHPDQFNYIIEHFNDKVDLENRLILKEIERCLNADEFLNIDRLREIEKNNPRNTIDAKPKGTLFDKESESSSSSQ
jgi:hypothetical protein